MEIAGHKINNWVIVGGVAGVGIVWYLYKRGSNSSSPSSSTSGTGVDPVTGLPYSEDNSVDPLTGMTYLQEAQEYGSVSAAESAVSANNASEYGSYGAYGYGSAGTAGYPTENVSGTAATGSSYATNAAWSQAVTAGLVALGYSSTDVASALGLFFAQQPLPTLSDGVSAASIIQAAEAEYGPPPQGTYNIIPANSNSTGAGSTGGTGSAGSGRLPAPGALHVSELSTGSAQIAWNSVPGATGYTVECKQGGANGNTVSGPFATNGPFANFGGLKSKTKYTAFVWPGDSNDKGGPGSNQPNVEISFTTK